MHDDRANHETPETEPDRREPERSRADGIRTERADLAVAVRGRTSAPTSRQQRDATRVDAASVSLKSTPPRSAYPDRPLRRRHVLRHMGAGLALVPFGGLLGCGDDDLFMGVDGGPGRDGGLGGDAGRLADGGADGGLDSGMDGSVDGGPDAPDATADAGPVDWASGGTGGIADEYPDPFTDPATCDLTCAMTLGPCYGETLERKDVSEGYPGLPTRLSLRVLDDACMPVEGAIVDIWHTRNSGIYSGPDVIDFCTTGDADARAHRYFRGIQTTDDNGRVDFDTCYPGWYPGRAIHIHFQIRIGSDEYVTSQLFFPDALTEELFGAHPDYVAFGFPDTTNETDGIAVGDAASPYILSYAQMPDGVLHAWKTIIVRSSLARALCSA